MSSVYCNKSWKQSFFLIGFIELNYNKIHQLYVYSLVNIEGIKLCNQHYHQYLKHLTHPKEVHFNPFDSHSF